ncbi:unnamed protein product [Rhizophagus irregularis]|nr:unnamed protein product [Rhizophagus irregularis]
MNNYTNFQVPTKFELILSRDILCCEKCKRERVLNSNKLRDKPSFGNIYLIIPSYPPCLISPTVEEFQKSLDIVTIEISNNYFADNYKNIIVIYCSGRKQGLHQFDDI